MRSPLPSLDVQGLPEPADRGLAELGLARWRERAGEVGDAGLAASMITFADDAKGARMLASLCGNSPFLTFCCLREPDFLLRLARLGPDATFAEVADGINRDLTTDLDRAALMRRLRTSKRRAALLVALADIAGQWPLERLTGALTELADASLRAALGFLLHAAHYSGELELPHLEDPERDSGVIVLGMGKLGARELNYSSDIDLIVLFDGERTGYRGTRSVQTFFTQLA